MVFSNATTGEKLRRFWYTITPSETSFERIEDVPDYLNEVRNIFRMLKLYDYISASSLLLR